MDEIKISIVIPSLNVGSYIEECVYSALNQTLKQIEILCIDAGSTDGTWEKLKKISELDERIILLHSDIKSYGHQVNMGLDVAKGKYVAILESDDYVDVDMYETLYNEAEEHDCDYIKSGFYSYYTVDNGDRFFQRKKTLYKYGEYSTVLEVKKYPNIAIDDWYLWNGMYKKSFIDENNIRLTESKGAAFQDIGFLVQVNIKAKRAYYIEDPLYRYCVDREGSSSNIGKSLEYSYNEFVATVERLNINSDLDSIEAQRFLFLRMAKSFLCCYGELAESSITTEARQFYYKWFKNELIFAIEKNIIGKEWIPEPMWNELMKLLESEDKYFEGISNVEGNLENWLGNSIESKVVVFGCGTFGFRANKWLRKRNYSIEAFMDNNDQLWGREINGVPVISPDSIRQFPHEIKYLVANEMHAEEIIKQIEELGVNKAHIRRYI